MTNAITQTLPMPIPWTAIVQAIAATFAAVGTISAVVVSLHLAWRNRQQFRMTTRLNVLPTLIAQTEISARRLEHDGLFFPRPGCGITWNPPTEIEALKVSLQSLKAMKVEDSKTFTYVVKENAAERVTESESAHDRIATLKLLIPVIERLIRLREEFEQFADKTRIAG